jgi:hypothetical protein
MQALRTWFSFRDAQKTSRKAQIGFERTARAKLAKEQSYELRKLLPARVLETMERRIESCWDRYCYTIDPDTGSTPQEIDAATRALKHYICQELKRIIELNGSLPPGKLRDWWDGYCE